MKTAADIAMEYTDTVTWDARDRAVLDEASLRGLIEAAVWSDRAQRSEQLQRVEVIGPDGFGDPLIACTRCGTELCSIELDDTMEALARIAETHGGEPCIPPCPNCGEVPCNETEKRQGVEGFCASCVHNAIRSGWEPGA